MPDYLGGLESHMPAGVTIEQVEDAERMMRYASVNGIPIGSALWQPLIKVRGEIEKNNLRDKTVVAFWDAVSKISSKIAPVTIESIKDGTPVAGRLSLPRRAALRYTMLGVMILFLLVISQGYWYALNAAVNEYSAAVIQIKPYAIMGEEYWREFVTKYHEEPKGKEVDLALIERISNEAKNAQNSANQPESRLLNDRNRLLASLSSSVAAAGRLSSWFTWIAFPSQIVQPPSAGEWTIENKTLWSGVYYWVLNKDSVKSMQSAKILLDIFSKYWLPILCGLLGATLYIIRTLATEIKSTTYIAEHNIGFNFRFFLGGAAGLAVAWLFGLESAKALGAGDIASSLSPLALAFVAGYSLDLLFTIIDRIVFAFSLSEAKTK